VLMIALKLALLYKRTGRVVYGGTGDELYMLLLEMKRRCFQCLLEPLF
jgi:hypothetical protein